MAHFAIDFGTTNTVIATDLGGVVTPVALPGLMAERARTPVVPSAVYFPEAGDGRRIGQQALDANNLGREPGFAHAFKPYLGRDRHTPKARTAEGEVSAEAAAAVFFQGLRVALRLKYRPRRKGLRGYWDDFQERRRPLLSDLTLTAPVDADESFRRHLMELGRSLGARAPRLVDEPVAAALGYGLNVARELTVLVVDWGGGTLDACAVRTGPKALAEGHAEVLAKSGAPLGGDHVDHWVVEALLFPITEACHEFEVDALLQARRAKEAAAIEGRGAVQYRTRAPRVLEREDLAALLALPRTESHKPRWPPLPRGAYGVLDAALEEVLDQLSGRHGLAAGDIDEVLLVGGSTMLPRVDSRVQRAFPAARVGERNPFDAVAVGACEFARGGAVVDQIYHDYALALADGSQKYYERVVAAGTPYPMPRDLEPRRYTPDRYSRRKPRVEIVEVQRLGLPPIEWQPTAGGTWTWRPGAPGEHRRAVLVHEEELDLRPGRAAVLSVWYRVDEQRYLRWTVRDGDRLLRDDQVVGRLR